MESESHTERRVTVCAFVTVCAHVRVRERERERERSRWTWGVGENQLGNYWEAGKSFPASVPRVPALRKRTRTKTPERLQ